MKKKFSYTRVFNATYEVSEDDGIKTITVEIPGIGKKSTQLGDLPIDFITKDLANKVFTDLEEK